MTIKIEFWIKLLENQTPPCDFSYGDIFLLCSMKLKFIILSIIQFISVIFLGFLNYLIS